MTDCAKAHLGNKLLHPDSLPHTISAALLSILQPCPLLCRAAWASSLRSSQVLAHALRLQPPGRELPQLRQELRRGRRAGRRAALHTVLQRQLSWKGTESEAKKRGSAVCVGVPAASRSEQHPLTKIKLLKEEECVAACVIELQITRQEARPSCEDRGSWPALLLHSGSTHLKQACTVDVQCLPRDDCAAARVFRQPALDIKHLCCGGWKAAQGAY